MATRGDLAVKKYFISKKHFSVVNSLLRGSTLPVNISQKNWFLEKLKKDEFRGVAPLSTLKISAILEKVVFFAPPTPPPHFGVFGGLAGSRYFFAPKLWGSIFFSPK